ncbi:Delta(12) fatty acid desaturase [Ceratocystis platani]|uniref:Delta(12) fatty acid desaturase n=1 Tax=Ceratocystis fimbriata f. sp. platani TaxID=88771 RepID=A0A0F8B2W7_CERFI|nr:Delta(12) fatty acid desaturase [Ceratocystis platani]
MSGSAVRATAANKKAAAAAATAVPEKGQQEFPTVDELRSIVPPHCFKPKVWISMSYLIKDLTMFFTLMWAAQKYIPGLENQYLRWGAWAAYGYVNGLIGTGLWILAHECGHGAFSLHPRFNNIIGWATHSLLMVPYFSWKYSHSRHHRYTGHMEKDMAFVPTTEAAHSAKRDAALVDPDLFEDVPIVTLFRLLTHQLFGFPLYLLTNATAGPESLQKETPWYRRSHFDPWSGVFRPTEAFYIFMSDVGLAITVFCVYQLGLNVGWTNMTLLYIVPYMWVHHWLVAITYLHHTHPDVPHYEPDSWSYVKGALATVDRDFGWVDRYIFHGIIGTHVVHHLFSRIPFYYAEDATEALVPVLGDLYFKEDANFWSSLWTTFRSCNYVVKDTRVPGAMKWSTQN